MELPLSGLKILSVEQYGAGPFGTQHLADLGAEVIKVENHRTGGDYARKLGPYFAEGTEGDDGSLFFQAINRNKKSLSLDLGNPEARPVFERLVSGADAVANNLRGDVPAKLGLTYDALKSANPAIVCAHCSAYGRDGERRDWPGYDFLMQAEAGYFHMSGEPDTPPTRMGLSVVDFMSGTYMALVLVSAVMAAQRTGEGRDVDVNLYDTALYNLSYLSAWALNSDYDPQRMPRSGHATLVPCQLYRTGDGWIFVMCNKERFWPVLCQALGLSELVTDPRFATYPLRAQNRLELEHLLDDAFSRNCTQEWLRRLRAKVPVAPVRTPREALTDPALRSSGGIRATRTTSGASFDLLRAPIQAGQNDREDTACPPSGHNTYEILVSAGYSEEEIRDFRNRGLI